MHEGETVGRNTLQEVAGDENGNGGEAGRSADVVGRGKCKEKRGAIGLHTECSEFLPNSLAAGTRVSRDGQRVGGGE